MPIKKSVGRRATSEHAHTGGGDGGDTLDPASVTAGSATITDGTVTNLDSKNARVNRGLGAFYSLLHNWQYESDTEFDNEGRYNTAVDSGAAFVADVTTSGDAARQLHVSHDGSSGSFEFGGHVSLIPISRPAMGDFYVRLVDITWTNTVRGYMGLFSDQGPDNNLGNSSDGAWFNGRGNTRVAVGGSTFGSSWTTPSSGNVRIEFRSGDTQFVHEGVDNTFVNQEPGWPIYFGIQLYDPGSNNDTADEQLVKEVEFGKLP